MYKKHDDGSNEFEEFYKNEKKVIFSLSRKFFFSVDEAEAAALGAAGEAWCVARATHDSDKSTFKTWFYVNLKNALREERLGRDGGDALLKSESFSDDENDFVIAQDEANEMPVWRVKEADPETEKILSLVREAGTAGIARLVGKTQRRVQQILKTGAESALETLKWWIRAAEQAQVALVARDLLGDPLPEQKPRRQRAPYCRVARRADGANQLSLQF